MGIWKNNPTTRFYNNLVNLFPNRLPANILEFFVVELIAMIVFFVLVPVFNETDELLAY